jgi:Putative virion core protein (lumpy skin disease virus)
MRCRNCGWENADGALRCVKCNQPLTPSMAAPPPPRPAPRPAAPSYPQPPAYQQPTPAYQQPSPAYQQPAPAYQQPAAPQPAPHRFTVLDTSAAMPDMMRQMQQMQQAQQMPPRPAPEPEPPKPELHICPKCGYPATGYSDACPNCGTVLIVQQPAPAPAPAPAAPSYAHASVTGPRLIPVDGGQVIPLRPGTYIEIGYHKYRFEL